MTATPKRSAKRATSSAVPLVAERAHERIVGVVGPLGRGQDVGQRLPDVVEVRRAGRPHVGQEARRGEPARGGQGEGRAGHQRRAPARHQRVGVEQRHGEVAHVGRGEGVHLGHDGADAGQPALRAQARLGRTGGPRREEQVAEGLGRDRGIGHLRRLRSRKGAQGAARVVRVEHEHALVVARDRAEGIADAGPLHQGEVGRVGDQELALGVREVPHQLVPPMRRVGPDHHRSGQRGRLEPEDELGHVVEHDGHVEGAVTACRTQPGRPCRGPGGHLGMGQTEVVRDQAEPVVAGPGEDGAGDGLGWRSPVCHRAAAGCVSPWGHCISERH